MPPQIQCRKPNPEATAETLESRAELGNLASSHGTCTLERSTIDPDEVELVRPVSETEAEDKDGTQSVDVESERMSIVSPSPPPIVEGTDRKEVRRLQTP